MEGLVPMLPMFRVVLAVVVVFYGTVILMCREF
jgi:hypothetical protein